MRVQRALPLVVGVTIALPAAAAASPKSDLGAALSRDMRSAGSESGAIVRDETAGERLFAWNQGTPRVLASNTKLFTLGATLAKRGPRGTIATRAMAAHPLKPDGVVRGNLYLVGGGDPAFGSESWVGSHYGGGGTRERPAARRAQAGAARARRAGGGGGG